MENKNTLNNNQNEDIDVTEIASLLKRKWHTIIFCIIGSALISIPYSLTRPKIWEGKFQIVLEEGNNTTKINSQANNLLGSLLGFDMGSSPSSLATEVIILESPSVLKPIYNYAKDLKILKESSHKKSFEDWSRTKLRIKLEEGTSVLNISYIDTDKEDIILILEKLSKLYQDYSGLERKEKIDSSIQYVKSQLNSYKEIAEKSNKLLDSYELEYGITSESGVQSLAGIDIQGILGMPEFNKTGGNLISSAISPSGGNPLSKLASINQELMRRRRYFKDNDPSIIGLLRERDLLRTYMEKTASGKIALPYQDEITKEEAQNIIITYRTLKRKATRNSDIVDSLESSLLNLKLDKAKSSKPWKLISKPTLMESPIAPKKKQMVFLGTFIGLITGVFAAIWKEKSEGIIYNKSDLIKKLPFPIIHDLSIEEDGDLEDHVKLLINGLLKEFESIALIPLGEFKNNLLEKYSKLLKKNLNGKKLIISRKLSETRASSTQIIITSLGSINNKKALSLFEKLKVQGKKVSGLIITNEKLNN